MSDYAAPSGPPPPKVPAGWKALWNDQYKEWFYVNTYTKKSQWDKPTEPVYGPSDEDALAGPPPGYDKNSAHPVSAEKSANLYHPDHANISEDERLARQLQQEEENRASRGMSDSYYQGGGSSGQHGQPQGSYGQQQQYGAQPEKKIGFLDKILGKAASSQPHHQQGYGQPHYGQSPYVQPQYGYGQQPHYMQQPARRMGGGLGTTALAGGGGLLGGMLLGQAMGDMGDGGGDGGGDYGGDGGGDGGGDYGGGDMGGGDMGGGDMGGGDMGGGDMGGGDF